MRVVQGYLRDNRQDLSNVEFAEKVIEINLMDGVTVAGRIDLVRRLDSGETTIIDLKSTNRAQRESVTEQQLHIYALGYEELTGRRADFVEIYNLDDGRRIPRTVDQEFIDEVKHEISGAAAALRANTLPHTPSRAKCRACDYVRMCSAAMR